MSRPSEKRDTRGKTRPLPALHVKLLTEEDQPAKQESPAELAALIRRTYQQAGVPLDPDRLERVKALPKKYLMRLLKALSEMGQEDLSLWHAAADDACQANWNEAASAAIIRKAESPSNNDQLIGQSNTNVQTLPCDDKHDD